MLHLKSLSQKSAGLSLRSSLVPSGVKLVSAARRPYFSFMDSVRDKLYKPFRHVQSFIEPDGINYESQLPEGYRLHGNTAASFSASITQNSIELN